MASSRPAAPAGPRGGPVHVTKGAREGGVEGMKPGGAPRRTVRPGRRRALGLLGLGLLGAVAGRGGPGRTAPGDGRGAAGAARTDAGASPAPAPREDRNKLGLHVNVWTFEAAA